MASHDRGECRVPRSKRQAVRIDERSGETPPHRERSEIEARLKELDFFLAALENRAPQPPDSRRNYFMNSLSKRKDPRALCRKPDTH